MTKLKGLFLGSAAAILAVTGAQAADPPVEVWDYVRICDAYGTKYYYIPQTETCLRIGGYTQWRARYDHGDEMNRGRNQLREDWNNANRVDTEFDMLGRARLWLDAREETEWGTLRAYMEFEANDGGSLNMRHAYLQILGFTAGHTDTTMNFGTGGGPNYGTISGDNGVSRNQLIRYEVPFGNGFSVAVAAEESDNTDTGIVGWNNQGTAALADDIAVGGAIANNGGDDAPDAAARIRVDQGWGSAQVSGIVRSVQVFESNLGVADWGEEDEVGYALRAGLKLNLNFLPNGGTIGGMFTWTHGASNWAADYAPDAVYNVFNNDIELVDTWSARGALEVGLSPTLSAGIFGGYTTVVDVEDTLVAPGDRQTETWWNVGFAATWSPVNNLDIGLDVIYDHEEDSIWTGITPANTKIITEDSENVWRVIVGATRTF